MKRIIVCIALTAIIFAGGTAGLFYSSSVSDRIAADIDEVNRLFLSGDSEGASAAAARASGDWQKFRSLNILSVDKDLILEITMSITRIESLLEHSDEEAITECALAKELIENYQSKNMPSILNIL